MLDFVKNLAIQGGEIALESTTSPVAYQYKTDHSLVSRVDHAIEDMYLHEIKQRM